MKSTVFFMLASLVGPGSVALAEMHLTVDTAAGQAGDKITIKAGFYLAEQGKWSIGAGGYVNFMGAVHTFTLDELVTDPGPALGFIGRKDEMLLVSDFFFATGRLDGGNFNFELAGVTRVGGPGSAVLAWGVQEGSDPFDVHAMSNDASRAGRSFNVQAGAHTEEQQMAMSLPGLYDVTLVAWDSNGKYTDSNPVLFRVNVVPAPGAAALAACGVLLTVRRRRG